MSNKIKFQSVLKQNSRFLLGAVLSACVANTAYSAPGTLANYPLFLGTSVDPNVMLLIDDSGSMDWEIMTSESVVGGIFSGNQPDGSNSSNIGTVTHRDYNDDGTADCGFSWDIDPNTIEDNTSYNGYTYIVEFGSSSYPDGEWDCGTADDESWRARNSSFNRLYYDPSKTYEPWAGVDKNGNTFQDMPITAALDDPYDPNSETIDLTTGLSGRNDSTGARQTGQGFRYYTWDDSNGNGLFDNDCDGLNNGTGGTDSSSNPCDTVREYLITNQNNVEQQNFANWFSYYRKREYVAKAAYGRVIANSSDMRMGLGVINNLNNPSNSNPNPKAAADDMNDDLTTGAKRALLDALYSINSYWGTPLRYALDQFGKYYECTTNDYFSSCPILTQAQGGSCQQNFTVLLTDGFYNGSFSISNHDGDDDTAFDSGQSGPFGDPYSDTLADISMQYYENDLSTSLPNQVPTSSNDDASHQHMVTFTIGFGVDGTLSGMPPNTTDPFTWPNPLETDGSGAYINMEKRIDDLRHAAFNGRGAYLQAQNSASLQSELEAILNVIDERNSSAAAVSFNSSSLSNNSMLYLTLFNTSKWSGQLTAYSLDGTTGAINNVPVWEASSILDARNLNSNDRLILTHNGSDGIVFESSNAGWNALSLEQQLDLCTGPETNGCSLDDGGTPADPSDDSVTGSTNIAQSRIDFLRGDRKDEGKFNNFRIRNSRLGDIIHSGTIFVGEPELDWPDNLAGTTPYSNFKSTYESRDEIIYTGANDGMLHGFRASDGEEVLAYIPGNLFSSNSNEGLHYLTDPSYSHRYYVDLKPEVSDVFIKTTPSGTADWRTILIGGERAGGRGYFALDVTDPSQFTTANAADLVLWEFSSDDDADVGFTYSAPIMTLMENGRWAAVFGNGYENTGSGAAQLFIVFLDGGLDGVWTDGSGGLPLDYVKITTGVGDLTDKNGLAAPGVVDLDGNGKADRAYAGDLRGNMWVFDLSNADPTQWQVEYQTSGVAKPLFTATDGTLAQPITSAPSLVKNTAVADDVTNYPNLLVLFGTGQYLVENDKYTIDAQTFYGAWDSGAQQLDRTSLIAQTVETLSPPVADVRVMTANPVDYTTDKGWYFDLPDSSERVIVEPIARRGIVLFNTIIPGNPTPCDFGGEGWLMALDIETGGRPDEPAYDLNGDGVVDQADYLQDLTLGNISASGEKFSIGMPTGSAILENNQYTAGTGTTGPNGSTAGGGTDDDGSGIHVRALAPFEEGLSGRLSWEELQN